MLTLVPARRGLDSQKRGLPFSVLSSEFCSFSIPFSYWAVFSQ